MDSRTISHPAVARRLLITSSFVTAGASSPTVFGGAIKSVQRLVDGVANPFYRITFDRVYDVTDSAHVVQFQAVADDPIARNLTVHPGPVTAAPALARAANQYDVVLRDAGVISDVTGQTINILVHTAY